MVGGRSLDDTDDEDEEDEDRNPIVLPHNCAYYDSKLGMGRRTACVQCKKNKKSCLENIISNPLL